MRYTVLGRSNLLVSTIGFGAWAIGGRQWGPVDDGESVKAVRRAVELGVNFFDTADVYGLGHSEELLGKTLAGGSQTIVATKVGLAWNGKGKIRHDLSGEYITSACEASLNRLRRESIDLYQIHWPDPLTPLTETIAALEALVAQGKVRYVGACNLPLELLPELCAYPWFVSYQGRFNLFDQEAKREIVPFCRRNNLGFIGYEPLAKGLLTGKFKGPPIFARGDHRKYDSRFTTRFPDHEDSLHALARDAALIGATPAQLALARLLEKGATCVIPGMKTAAQVEENVGAAGAETAIALAGLEKSGIKINRNHRRDLAELIEEIAGRDGLTAAQVISAPEIEAPLNNPDLNGPQKLAGVKKALSDRRYPTYARVCQAFAAELKRANLSPGIKVTPTPYFEDSNLKVESTGKAPADNDELRKVRKRLAEADVVKNAFQAAKDIN